MCLFVSLHLKLYERVLYIVHQPSITSPKIKSKLNPAANTQLYKREDGEVSYGRLSDLYLPDMHRACRYEVLGFRALGTSICAP